MKPLNLLKYFHFPAAIPQCTKCIISFSQANYCMFICSHPSDLLNFTSALNFLWLVSPFSPKPNSPYSLSHPAKKEFYLLFPLNYYLLSLSPYFKMHQQREILFFCPDPCICNLFPHPFLIIFHNPPNLCQFLVETYLSL